MKQGIWCGLMILGLGLSLPAAAQFGGGTPIHIGNVQGSVGIGYTDFSIQSPSQNFKMDRGTFLMAQGERGFDVLNLYLTISLGYMTTSGTANYSYTNLSETQTYTASDANFDARLMQLGLGLKMKLIDDYWFRPYIEAGGLGSYDQISYTSKQDLLSAQGNGYKTKDTIMGYGYYGEAGFEIQFSDRFGVKIAARLGHEKTKKLETLANTPLEYNSETYYLAGLVGF